MSEQDPKRVSDQIRIIKAERGANDVVLILTHVTRSLTCLAVVISGGWLLAHKIEIPQPAWGIAALVVIGTFDLKNVIDKIRTSVLFNGHKTS